jgi:hypothetical protein
MRKAIYAALPLALLALAAPAAAKDGGNGKHYGHKTRYRATLAPVQVEAPAAEAARRGGRKDDARGHRRKRGDDGVRGKAELVDGRKKDRVKVRVRGLEPGGDYTWEVRSASGDSACGGEAVDGFRYRELRIRRHGGGRSRGVSRSFTAEDGVSYALVVAGADGDVACGEFERKGKRRKGGDDGDAGGDDSGAECGDDSVEDDPLAEDATYDESCDDDSGSDGCDDESGDAPVADGATYDYDELDPCDDSVDDDELDDSGDDELDDSDLDEPGDDD